MTNNISKEESKQKIYYNKVAQQYDKHYANAAALEYRYSVFDLVLKDLDLKGKRVLDAMCGGGEATRYFIERGADVIGLDISEECCKLYKKRYPDGKIVCSSILQTEFMDSYFDVVLTDSLHHLHPNLQQGMTEICRILKPDGYFCCWEPSANSLINILRNIWYKLDRKYFENNEKAIDIKELTKSGRKRFNVADTIFGGNLAYLFVNCSLIFRIPIKYVNVYASILFKIERMLNCFQPSFLFGLFV